MVRSKPDMARNIRPNGPQVNPQCQRAPRNKAYPAFKGRHVRTGMRQSMPSNSIASCAELMASLPLEGDGQTNRPRSSRFENRHAPWLSHQMIFNKSPRRPRNTNKCPEKGSCSSVFWVRRLRPLKPFLISVTPAASQTFVFTGSGITSKPGHAIDVRHGLDQRLPIPSGDGRSTTQCRLNLRTHRHCSAMSRPWLREEKAHGFRFPELYAKHRAAIRKCRTVGPGQPCLSRVGGLPPQCDASQKCSIDDGLSSVLMSSGFVHYSTAKNLS